MCAPSGSLYVVSECSFKCVFFVCAIFYFLCPKKEPTKICLIGSQCLCFRLCFHQCARWGGLRSPRQARSQPACTCLHATCLPAEWASKMLCGALTRSSTLQPQQSTGTGGRSHPTHRSMNQSIVGKRGLLWPPRTRACFMLCAPACSYVHQGSILPSVDRLEAPRMCADF